MVDEREMVGWQKDEREMNEIEANKRKLDERKKDERRETDDIEVDETGDKEIMTDRPTNQPTKRLILAKLHFQ